ncbi:hypothetical protein BDV36DRAFT_274048 [Aspergillus pseudocaelatus]|uniref:F-box domain-containing protein n=1 Tax=Aspergillus pseudocaelatus TaxID=1825620 RepID=A0ABQ6W3A5_9EURO|nr:hypothetical protein BDV36DRAFT_274048 [Aspergillus pseudocaelatus]
MISNHLETYPQRFNLAISCRRFYIFLLPTIFSSIELSEYSARCLIPLTLQFIKHRSLAKNVRCLTVREPNEGRWIGCMVRKDLGRHDRRNQPL